MQRMEYEDFPVVLKCLHNSQDISSDFLRIIETHMFVSNYGDRITKCYGITKDPESRNFMIVMGYAKDGSLRQYLNSSFNSIKWNEKLVILQVIAQGLDDIHQKRPINAIDNKDDDNSFGEYSESIEAIDFTKLDPRSS
ncbi:kinase-like domain-containing protein [Rhizophagus irregularis DAOM 181602=DAOM 197198]|nr:kinase-like domain-containing protein [Rhizophagus irregularis DAOM 181602=DAOM 197198]